MKKQILFFCFVAIAAITIVNAITSKNPINDKRIGLWPDDPQPNPNEPNEPKPKLKSTN